MSTADLQRQGGVDELCLLGLDVTWRENLELSVEAQSVEWEAFLERVLPDPEVRRFVQKAAGYSLTGDVSEQVLFFLYGRGANGKTTFINAVLDVLGDYARQAPHDLLIKKYGTNGTHLEEQRAALERLKLYKPTAPPPEPVPPPKQPEPEPEPEVAEATSEEAPAPPAEQADETGETDSQQNGETESQENNE